MNSSGIKRGLATTAVSALAIAGLPLFASSAHADSLAEQAAAADSVVLQTPATIGSVKNDGSESTIHMVATAGSDVQQVRFQYQSGGNWITIATVSRTAGAFSTEWAPPVATYNTAVNVRAVALGSVGTEIGTPDANAITVSANADSVDIAYTPGATVGVFEQPYTTEGEDATLGAVSGTTSDLTADPDLTFSSPSGTGAATQEDVAGTVANGATSRSYSAPVDFSGYTFDTTAPVVNEALIVATAEGDDAEPVNIYKQTISNVSVEAENPTVQGAATTDITVTVLDQNGNPVVGAQVVGEDAPVNSTEYTNSKGEATFTGATGSAQGSTYDFYVNTTDTDAYENGTDFRRSVTVGSYTPAAASITPSSKDGLAFDVDENAAGDLRVKVVDQNGNALSGQVVQYSLAVDLFPTTAVPNPTNPTPTTGTVTTGGDGFANIPFTDKGDGEYTLSTYINRDGTPGQGAGDLSGTDLVFKAGDAELEITDPEVAAAGTTATFDATLALIDGTPLAGRAVRFTYAPNGDDVVVAAESAQPDGTTRVSNTIADATTDADGVASVALSDPANTPARSELDGELDAQSIANTIGNANANAASVDVEFVTGDIEGTPTVTITANNGTGTPGEVTTGEVTVVEDDPTTTNVVEADPVANTLITLTVDGDAFFTTANGEPANPSAGDLQGDIVERGQEITLVTDANGQAEYYIGIKGSDDFNDDGEATVDVTVTADGASDTEDYDFSTDNPLNGGEVMIELASAQFQDSGVLPLLPTSDRAAYDVMVSDQFGNPVAGESVVIDIDGVGTATNGTIVTDFNDNAEFYVASGAAGTSMPVGTWDAPVNDYTGNPAAPRTTSEDIEGDGPEVEFYTVDFANSTFELTQQGPDTVPVGTTVIMTYSAMDQNGEPIEFEVDFFRTGPDEFGDGEENANNPTGEDGMVNYVFQGAAQGTATITAIGYTGLNDDQVVPESQVSDTVTFGRGGDGIIDIQIAGDDTGPAKDILDVLVEEEAAGEEVTIYKIRGKKPNKRLVEVRSKVVPEDGQLTLQFADRNGNKKTRFIAKVEFNGKTFKSNTQKIR